MTLKWLFKLMTTTAIVGLFIATAESKAAPIRLKNSGKGGTVTFLATGRPSFLNIEGKGEGAKGTVEVTAQGVQGEFVFPLNSLDTGIDLRNEHMKENYLEVDKFPSATLTLSQVDLPEKWSLEKPDVRGAKFSGHLRLRGQTSPVTGEVSLEGSGTTVQAKAQFKTYISAFNIEVPSYVGVTVEDEVEVRVVISDLQPVAPTAQQ